MKGYFVKPYVCRLRLFHSIEFSFTFLFRHLTFRQNVVVRPPHPYDMSHRTERNRLGLSQSRLKRPKQDLTPSHIRSSMSSPLTYLGAYVEMDVHHDRGSEWLA
ncbi:hypothetical protein FPOAC2_05245 [Fusarium poae]